MRGKDVEKSAFQLRYIFLFRCSDINLCFSFLIFPEINLQRVSSHGNSSEIDFHGSKTVYEEKRKLKNLGVIISDKNELRKDLNLSAIILKTNETVSTFF